MLFELALNGNNLKFTKKLILVYKKCKIFYESLKVVIENRLILSVYLLLAFYVNNFENM